MQHALSLPFSDRGGGKTNTQAALHLLRSSIFTSAHGDRKGVANICIFVTDGHSNVKADKTLTEAAAVRQSGVELYVVGVGDNVNMAEVNGMASTPSSDHVVTMTTKTDSAVATSTVLNWLCR